VTEPPWTTIPALIADSAERYADLEALVEGEVRLDYRQFGDAIADAARAHMAAGMAKGDRFSVWAPNMWEWPIVALGGHTAGGVLVPINTRFKGREAVDVLRRARVTRLFTVTEFLSEDYVAMLRATGEALPDLEEIVVLRGPVPDGCTSWNDYLARGSAITDAQRRERTDSITGDDLCHILFTSGTTGAPKGAMLRHYAACKVYKSWAELVGLRAGDRYLMVYPFLHSAGLHSGILACIMAGACNLPHAVFDVPSVMRRIVEERVSMLPGPPAVFQTILNHPDLAQFDMSSLRLCVTGAATIPVQLILDMRARLGFESIVTGYGLTECTGTATMCRYDDPPEKIANSSGRAIPDVEVRIVDPQGHELPRGEPGEILIRGYNVMVGYLDDPAQTAEAVDADGWLHSGDIGVMDEDGYLDITDRLKDMFIVGGFNAYPAEIEGQMLRHPGIGQVAVVGIDDPRLGEIGVAFVIPRPGTPPTPAEIIAWCREEMANYKVPRRVELVDTLPLNASGKVLKHELRDRARANG
jgi:acyl-CoA synthetase (AMP-forming)/AMP-acid ligase II